MVYLLLLFLVGVYRMDFIWISYMVYINEHDYDCIPSWLMIMAGWWFGTMEFYDFPYIGNVIIPTDELIFFRGVGQPPTRYIWCILMNGFIRFDLVSYGLTIRISWANIVDWYTKNERFYHDALMGYIYIFIHITPNICKHIAGLSHKWGMPPMDGNFTKKTIRNRGHVFCDELREPDLSGHCRTSIATARCHMEC